MRLTEAVNITHIKTNIMENTKVLARKADVKGFLFWAKWFDTNAHIVKIDSNNVGGEVYCGRFGAFLGNNYASYFTYVCPECLAKMQSEKPTVI
jgi:hypothetical protein